MGRPHRYANECREAYTRAMGGALGYRSWNIRRDARKRFLSH
jgi:hypothetical protein